MFQRDYLMRIIQQAAEALARAMRLLRAKQQELAEDQLREGYSALGIDRELLLLLDGPTLQRQLDDDERIAMAARLLLGDAELRAAKGEPKAALRHLKAARRLAALLRASDAVLDEELARVGGALDGDG